MTTPATAALRAPCLEPAVAQVLDAYHACCPASSVARAQRALQTFLPPPGQRFSRLTGDCFPLEFVFAGSGRGIRYTAECAPEKVTPSLRLGHAQAALEHLGCPLQPDAWHRLAQLQPPGTALKFGVWVGGRHGADEDRYKVYAESCGDAAAALAERWIGPQDLLPRRRTPGPVLVGYEPADAAWEFYYRARQLQFWQVQVLLARIGLAQRASELRDCIGAAWGRAVRDDLPASRVGWSYRFSGISATFSLFFFARSIFGGDGAIRAGLLRLAESNGWQLNPYPAISEPLQQRRSAATLHGMLGFRISPHRRLNVSIGLRPPEPKP